MQGFFKPFAMVLGFATLMVPCLAPAEALPTEIEKDIEFARSFVKVKLESARTGTEFDWDNPESGRSGSLRIVETQILDRGMPCRWYEWSLESGPKTRIETEGKGCRLGNGDWLLEETAVIRETVEVKVEVKVPVEVPAPEPADPMAGVIYTQPRRLAGSEAPPAGGHPEREQETE